MAFNLLDSLSCPFLRANWLESWEDAFCSFGARCGNNTEQNIRFNADKKKAPTRVNTAAVLARNNESSEWTSIVVRVGVTRYSRRGATHDVLNYTPTQRGEVRAIKFNYGILQCNVVTRRTKLHGISIATATSTNTISLREINKVPDRNNTSVYRHIYQKELTISERTVTSCRVGTTRWRWVVPSSDCDEFSLQIMRTFHFVSR